MDISSCDISKWGFAEFVQNAVREGVLCDIPVASSPSSATICLHQKEFVNFAGINFLGLQQDADVLAHFTREAYTYGLVTGGSRLTQGICQAHRQLEEELCRLTGKERAITFASGLLANIGFIHAMSSNFYLNRHCQIDNSDTVFVLDRDCHWSLWKAVERFPYGKQVFSFQHNNPHHLKEILATLAEKKVVVVFESLYSADGTVAPIGDLLDICEQYQALSYVDDANGFLIYGAQHRPFATEFAQLSRATFIMMSFSKSVGLEGGAIVGPADPIHAFELLSGTSIFTAAMQPPTASTASLIIQRLCEHPQLIDDYLAKVAQFRAQLIEIGCTINPVPSYITSIFVGSDEKAKYLRPLFREYGYIVPVFQYPAVKQNQAVLRIILNYHHTEAHIHGFLKTLANFKEKYEF
jgi:8-amino-7-oxononanoate synthase